MHSGNLSTKTKLFIGGVACMAAGVALSATPIFPLVGLAGVACFGAAAYLWWCDDPLRLSNTPGTYEHYKARRDQEESEKLSDEIFEQRYRDEKSGR